MLLNNRTKDFHITDKCLFDLPDNDSLLFQLSRKSDWQFRIYAQCLMRSSMDYLIYFVTLTYATSHLPRFNGRIGFTDFSFSCFSREHIRKFIRGIQQDLLRKYGVKDIDYIVCSEYGGNGTKRPHYHLLLLVPRFKVLYRGFLSDCDAVNVTEIHKLILKHWSVINPDDYDNNGVPLRSLRGWVLPAHPFGFTDQKGRYHKPLLVSRKNIGDASIYVSKYCTKQLDFYGCPGFRNALKYSKKFNDIDTYHKLLSCRPFIKTSQHFGECINDLVTSPFVPWASNLIEGVGRSTNDKLYDGFRTPIYRKGNLSVPYYNKRKLLVDRILIDKTRFLDYSTLTIRHVYTYASRSSSLALSYAPYEYRRKVDDNFFKISSFFGCDYPNQYFRDWLKENSADYDGDLLFLSNFNNYCIFRHLSIYRVTYQDRICPTALLAESYYTNDITYPFFVSETRDVFDDYDQSMTDYFEYETITTSISSFFPFSASHDYTNDVFRLFPSLRFDGNESIDIMCLRSRSYYLTKYSFVRNPLKNVVCPSSFTHCLFNNFSCFDGFDRCLKIIFSFFNYRVNQILKANDEKERKRKYNINLVYS